MYLQSPDPDFRQTVHNLLPEQRALPRFALLYIIYTTRKAFQDRPVIDPGAYEIYRNTEQD